jgi:hypothetical protein
MSNKTQRLRETNQSHQATFAFASVVQTFSLHNGSEEDELHGEYELKDSFLLDSAAPIHVCNNKERFTEYTPTDRTKMLRAADSFLPILGYGTVKVQ